MHMLFKSNLTSIQLIFTLFTNTESEQTPFHGAVRNLVSRGVVVVTINYRVGVIGFFTTFTENFPPNRGMYDMVRRMIWLSHHNDRHDLNHGR